MTSQLADDDGLLEAIGKRGGGERFLQSALAGGVEAGHCSLRS
jgi:hypothetical protein